MTVRAMTAKAGILAALLGLIMPAPAASQERAGLDLPVRRFPVCCPQPEWWDRAGEVPHVLSMEAFLEVWQDQSIEAERKSKALFQAIQDNLWRDDAITASAIAYFDSVGRSYSHLRALLEFGAARFRDYDRPLGGYGGKAGDLSAQILRALARVYLAEGEPARAVPVLEYVLGPRRDAVNDHILELSALTLGEALDQLGREPEAVKVLVAARRDFEGSWEPRIDAALDEIRRDMGPAYYLHDTRVSGPVFLVALGVLLAAGLLRRRRPRLG